MPGVKAFFDTNVLLYLLSEEAAKADRVEELLTGGGTISVQVVKRVCRSRLAKVKPVMGRD